MDDHIDFILDPDAICRRDVKLVSEALESFNTAVRRLFNLGYLIEIDTRPGGDKLPDLYLAHILRRVPHTDGHVPKPTGGVAAPVRRPPRP